MARRGMSYRFCRQGRRAASAGARRQREALRHMEEVMRLRIPRAAKALVVLTAAGLLLGGCYYHRPHYGGSHYVSTGHGHHARSAEHTSELQSLLRTSYAVFCLKKKTQQARNIFSSVVPPRYFLTSPLHYA